jgi:hypothetical protein
LVDPGLVARTDRRERGELRYLYLHGYVRKASGTQVGDRVDAEVSFDSAYRNGPMHPMPAWFRAPLHKQPKARAAWDALIPSRQKEILRYFSWLKSPEARARNLQRALHVLIAVASSRQPYPRSLRLRLD